MQTIPSEAIQAPADLSGSVRYHPGRWFLAACGIILWGALTWQLRTEWTVNEQYQYGWFVPLFTVYLFWLRWPERPMPGEVGVSPVRVVSFLAGFGLLLLLPVRLFEVANPEWRPLSWLHALIVIGLTLLVIWRLGGVPWTRHFAFPVCFFLVAIPWVTPIETPIVQGLQRFVAAVVTEIMGLMGIPSVLEGSVIRLRTGVVGVNEACSGVRSLQTSLMAGLLFGELNRLTRFRRLFLVISLIVLAISANVLRGAFLVWTAAQRGVEAVDGVHDLAGNIVLLIVVVGAFGVAELFKRTGGQVLAGQSETEGRDTSVKMPGGWIKGLVAITCWLLLVELGVEGWYRLHERGLMTQPRWGVVWPEKAAQYRPVKIEEPTKLTLRYDQGGGGAWQEGRESWLMYFFRWEPGQSSVLRAKAHRPDVCFPNTGWKQTDDHGVQFYEALPGLSLPFRHFEFIHPGTGNGKKSYAHAFFCLQEDKTRQKEVPGKEANHEVSAKKVDWDWGLFDRLRMVQMARRDLGQQVMELVITSQQPVAANDAQTAFREQLRNLVIPASK